MKRLIAGALMALSLAAIAQADELVLHDGRRYTGQLIEQDGSQVKFKIVYDNGGSAQITVPSRDVKSIAMGPLPEPKPATPAPTPTPTPTTPRPTPTPTPPAGQPGPTPPPGQAKRPPTKAEVEALIDQAGKSKPEWWDAVALDYPKTLDLNWPDKPGGGWNPNVNIGQYFFSVINENQSRWKQGAKFAHFLVEHYADNPRNRLKAMLQLADVYGTLLQDYPRSAYWYRKADQQTALPMFQGIRLAECYWKMGSKPMALEQLNRQRQFSINTIKLLGEMGELSKALQLANQLARSYPDEGLMAAGDACRHNGQFKQALDFYDKLVSLKSGGRRLDRNRKRAADAAEAIRLFETVDLSKIPDGSYTASSQGYASMIKVRVTVKAGRIEDVKVVEHHEKQYLTALDDPIRQIIAKQSVKGIDTTTRATITAEGVINAAAKALAEGMKPQ